MHILSFVSVHFAERPRLSGVSLLLANAVVLLMMRVARVPDKIALPLMLLLASLLAILGVAATRANWPTLRTVTRRGSKISNGAFVFLVAFTTVGDAIFAAALWLLILGIARD